MRPTRVRLKHNIGCLIPFVLFPMLGLFYIIFPLITRPLRIYNTDHQTILFYFLVIVSTTLLMMFFMYDPTSKPKFVEVSHDGITFPDGIHVDRRNIQHVFFEKDDLILLNGKRMTHTYKNIGSTKKLQHVLMRYNYLVVHQDPYLNEYQPWYRDHPELSVEENGLVIKMSQLYSNDWDSEAENLRIQLRTNHGIYLSKNFSRPLFRRIHL